MDPIQDDFRSIQINIAPQGQAYIVSVVGTPNPALAGETVNVVDSMNNNGATDTMWVRNFVNSSQVGDTWAGLVNSGSAFTNTWSFVMPASDAIIRVEIGHMEGATEVQDDSLEVTVNLLALPHAAFYGTVTYNPGQQVEPGTPVTLTYQVDNIGGAGTLWGGLYTLDATPQLIGGYWEQAVTPGVPITKSVQITVDSNLDAQLLCGHFE